MSDNDTQYLSVLIEEIRDQNRAVLESVGQMQETMRLIATRAELQEVATDVKVVRAAVTDISRQQSEHDRRLAQLEAV